MRVTKELLDKVFVDFETDADQTNQLLWLNGQILCDIRDSLDKLANPLMVDTIVPGHIDPNEKLPEGIPPDCKCTEGAE